jgi:hypothetical protein
MLVGVCADATACGGGPCFTLAVVDEAVLTPDAESVTRPPGFDGAGLTEGNSS